MRIACVHVPQFALQCLGRVDPPLRGAPVAVVGAGFDPSAGVRPSLALHSPIVLACSRAAWTLGVRLGMTASAARFVSSELRVVAADAPLERETVRAIADTLLGASAVVDTGGRVGSGGAHLAMYCEVPSKMRGTTFGDRLLELLDVLGLAARIGIADDRFTAWVAAAHGTGEGVPRDRQEVPRDGAGGVSGASDANGASGANGAGGVTGMTAPRKSVGAARGERGVVIVPRGGSAAFLAPRPLSLLAITPEVQHMLEALGVRTLGEFAALPAPSVSRPLEADYQALARGDSGCTLRPYAPEAPIREEIVVGHTGSLFGGAVAVTALAERLASRLRGRARGASRLEVAITGAGGERVVAVAAGHPAVSPDEIVALIAPLISEATGASTRLRIMVVGEAIAGAAAAVTDAAAMPALPSDAPAVPSPSADERADPAELADLGQLVSMSPSGQGPWPLDAPQAMRAAGREVHRRTRRAKQRRRTVTFGQSQLFGNIGNIDRSG